MDGPGACFVTMQSLELKVPPPVVALLVALAMWFAARATTSPAMPLSVRVALATMFAVLGVAFSGTAAVLFSQANTTRNPLRPTTASALVRSGAYKFSRNPMYLGLLLLLLGWAAALSSVASLLGPVAFAAYITRFQIKPEERALAALFGAEYADYEQRVRRWL
jgi:protein-S-isoprenylcysteine O-methyltransferase Ste14